MTVRQNYIGSRILNDFPRGETIDGLMPSQHPAYKLGVAICKSMDTKEEWNIPCKLSEELDSLSKIRNWLKTINIPDDASVCFMDFSIEGAHVLPPYVAAAFNIRNVFQRKTLKPNIKGKYRTTLNVVCERICLPIRNTEKEALIVYQETKIKEYSYIKSHHFLLPLLREDLKILKSNRGYRLYG